MPAPGVLEIMRTSDGRIFVEIDGGDGHLILTPAQARKVARLLTQVADVIETKGKPA